VRLHYVLQAAEILILYMPAIFSQMQCNAVRASLFCHQCGLNRVRVAGASRLAQGCDMVDIYAEEQVCTCLQFNSLVRVEYFMSGRDVPAQEATARQAPTVTHRH